MEGILTISQKEADRLKIIAQIESRSMTIEETSEVLEVSKRQMFRLLKKVKEEGSKGVINKLRGNGSVYYSEGILTDLGRAMKELGEELIFARSPQAKDRVEIQQDSSGQTGQGIKAEGIDNIAQANRFLQRSFTRSFNDRFSVSPEVPDGHKSIEGLDLRKIFCYKTQRQVRNDYTINLSGGYIQLLKSEAPLPRLSRV